MSDIRVSKPVEGAPVKFETKLQKDIYELLLTLGIDFLRVENDPAVTMEDCKAIDAAFGQATIKTILLTNRQKTKFYLLSMPAEKPFVTKDFGAALGIPRVSFADTEILETLLATPRGAASPLSLVADKGNRVEFIIDNALTGRESLVCTDGTLHGFISISTNDMLERFIPATFHGITRIDL